MRTQLRIGQQECLAPNPKTLAIDVRYIHDTRILDSSCLIRLTYQSRTSVKFHLRVSGDPEDAASEVVGAGVALSERADTALREWTVMHTETWTFV